MKEKIKVRILKYWHESLLFHYLVFFLFFILLFNFKIAALICALCFLTVRLRFLNKNILHIISLVAWLFVPFFWQIENKINFLSGYSFVTIVFLRVCTISIICTIAYFLMSLNSKKVVITYLCINSLMFYIFYSNIIDKVLIVQIGQYFLSTYKYFILPISFLIFYQEKSIQTNSWFLKLQKIPLMLPAWNIRPVLPIGYAQDLDMYDNKIDNDSYVNSLKSSTRLIFFSILTLVIIAIIKFIIYQQKEIYYFQLKIVNKFNFPEFLYIQDIAKGYEQALLINQSVLKKWLSIILGFIYIYADRIFMLNVYVIMARFSGYNLVSSFNEPWKAKSIGQFYGRILYYYNQVLMVIFVSPLKQLLHFIPNKIYRFYLSLILGITIGGFYFHFFVRDFERTFEASFYDTVFKYMPTLLYFFSISIVIVWSQYISHKSLEKYLVIKNQFLKVIFYLVVWSLIYNIFVATFHARTTFDKYILYFLGLF